METGRREDRGRPVKTYVAKVWDLGEPNDINVLDASPTLTATGDFVSLRKWAKTLDPDPSDVVHILLDREKGGFSTNAVQVGCWWGSLAEVKA